MTILAGIRRTVIDHSPETGATGSIRSRVASSLSIICFFFFNCYTIAVTQPIISLLVSWWPFQSSSWILFPWIKSIRSCNGRRMNKGNNSFLSDENESFDWTNFHVTIYLRRNRALQISATQMISWWRNFVQSKWDTATWLNRQVHVMTTRFAFTRKDQIITDCRDFVTGTWW